MKETTMKARSSLSHRFCGAAQGRSVRSLMAAAALFVGSVHRHAAAGFLDQSFGNAAIENIFDHQPGEVFAVLVQPDGKIIIGGAFDRVAGQSRRQIARLEADGSLDPSFTSPFEASSGAVLVSTLALDASGEIFVGGIFKLKGSLTTLVKLKTDGSVDSAFVPEYALTYAHVIKVTVAGDRLYVATSPGTLDRLNASGSFDAAFTHFSDTTTNSNGIDFAIEPGGALTLGLDESVVGLGNDGKLNSAFVALPAPFPTIHALSGGDVLAFANFAAANATAPDKRFVRVKPNGNVDSSFNVDRSVRLFVGVQPDDKLLIEQQLPSGDEGLVRLTSNGTPDGFVVPLDYLIRASAPYPDHRIVIVGGFGQVEHTQRTAVARLFETDMDDAGGGSAGASGSGSAGSAGAPDSAGAAGSAGARTRPARSS